MTKVAGRAQEKGRRLEAEERQVGRNETDQGGRWSTAVDTPDRFAFLFGGFLPSYWPY